MKGLETTLLPLQSNVTIFNIGLAHVVCSIVSEENQDEGHVLLPVFIGIASVCMSTNGTTQGSSV